MRPNRKNNTPKNQTRNRTNTLLNIALNNKVNHASPLLITLKIQFQPIPTLSASIQRESNTNCTHPS